MWLSLEDSVKQSIRPQSCCFDRAGRRLPLKLVLSLVGVLHKHKKPG
jgi:hypothetical protein